MDETKKYISYMHWGWVIFIFSHHLFQDYPLKKKNSITQAFKTPTTYLTLQLPTSTPLKTLNLTTTQTLPL
jgi:hypothetical protein